MDGSLPWDLFQCLHSYSRLWFRLCVSNGTHKFDYILVLIIFLFVYLNLPSVPMAMMKTHRHTIASSLISITSKLKDSPGSSEEGATPDAAPDSATAPPDSARGSFASSILKKREGRKSLFLFSSQQRHAVCTTPNGERKMYFIQG